MPIITAEEFKLRMRTTGSVSNVQVDEVISYYMADIGNIPNNMTITNCRLSSFYIAKNQINSLTFNKGSVGELHIETESGIQELTINKTNITSIELVETNVGKFALSPGQVQKVSLTGRMATVVETVIIGGMQMIQLNRFQGNIFNIMNCKLESFDLNDLTVSNFLLNNVTCPREILLNFDSSRPDHVNAINLKADLKFRYERTREIFMIKPVKNFDFTLLPSS